MAKSTNRLHKRPPRLDRRSEGTSAGGDRNRSGLGQAKSRSSITDNKCVRIAAIMFLPVVFGVFGLIVFPPSFDLSANNATNTTKEPIFNGDVSDKAEHKNARKDRSNLQKEIEKNKDQNKVKAKQEKENTGASQTRKDKSERQKSSGNFKPTILDSLAIQEITVEGKVVGPVELTKDKPESLVKIYKFDGFLSERECAGLKKVHQRHLTETNALHPIICFDSLDTLRRHVQDAGMKDVSVSSKDFTQGTMCANASFSEELGTSLTWSHSTSFYPMESKFSTIFEDRVFEATGLKPSNGGKFQITSYPEGIGYKTHTDCVLGNSDKRDRYATILVYLQDVEEGGETHFPELGISVKPKRGLAIIWNNMNSSGECEPVSIHEAAQVKQGHKFIIQRWYYYHSFPYLGRRAPEPDLPPRAPGQPRVNCDEYEHGSCRWYDEWNNDHLTEYRALKSGIS